LSGLLSILSASKVEHFVSPRDTGVMAQGAWVVFRRRFHFLPFKTFFLLVFRLLKIAYLTQVKHPEIAEGSFSDIMATKNIKSKFKVRTYFLP